MLDEFETGMSSDRIDQLFNEVQSALVPFIGQIRDSSVKPSLAPLSGKFNVDAQKSVCQKIVNSIGFDESHGRIDVSVHPFTMSLSSADVRITSRFSDKEWYQGTIYGVFIVLYYLSCSIIGVSDFKLPHLRLVF